MEKAKLMEQVVQAIGKLTDEHKNKSRKIDSDGLYEHREYETGTYSSGYSQCLIDVYKALRNI